MARPFSRISAAMAAGGSPGRKRLIDGAMSAFGSVAQGDGRYQQAQGTASATTARIAYSALSPCSPPRCRHRNPYASAHMKALCALSAAPACPPSTFS